MSDMVNFADVRTWLREIESEKSAAAKSAAPMSEHTGDRGKTTHPIGSIDDGLSKVQTGARAAEHKKNVTEGVVGSPDATPENPGKSQADVLENIGLKQSLTGEDPATERGPFKSRIPDPGTSSMINGDHLGEKYAAWAIDATSKLSDEANRLLAAWTEDAAGTVQPVTAAPAEKTAGATPAPATPSTPSPQNTIEPGYEIAALLGLDKVAADQVSQHTLAAVIEDACAAGDRVGRHMLHVIKRAAEEKKPSDGDGDEDDPPAPAAGGDAGGGGEMPMPIPGGGGDAPMPIPGGDAAAAGGDMPTPGAGADGSPPMDPEMMHKLQLLLMAMQELGLGGNDVQSMTAGGPPDVADAGVKMASDIKAFQRSGRFENRMPKSAQERQTINKYKALLIEMGANKV